MNKTVGVVIGVVVVAGLAVGGYFLFRGSPKTSPSSSSNSPYTATTPNSNQTSTSNQSSAINNAVLVTKTNSSIGQYLAAPSGKTLYTYSGDTTDTSNCTGSCLVAWPAYVDTGSTSNLPTNVGTIKRKDNGQIQYTYNGMSLYYYVGDTKPGDVTGNNVAGFNVAKP